MVGRSNCAEFLYRLVLTNSKLWEGSAFLGRINKSTNNVGLTANVIKKAIGLELSEADEMLEELLANG